MKLVQTTYHTYIENTKNPGATRADIVSIRTGCIGKGKMLFRAGSYTLLVLPPIFSGF